MRIPLIMVGPGVPKNIKVGSAVGNPDIATTVAALGRATPGRVQDGVDITRVLAASVKAGRTLYRPIPVAAWPTLAGRPASIAPARAAPAPRRTHPR